MRGSFYSEKKVPLAVLLLVILLFSLPSCSRRGEREVPENLILITLDTTRADHLGCYGYAKARTPHLDRFANESVLFEHAVCPAPSTEPSHATMMTGFYPPVHGVRVTGRHTLPDRMVTLAEILKSEGYQTGAVVSGDPLTRRFGMSQGFDDYEDSFYKKVSGQGYVIERPAEESVGIAMKWLEEHKDSKFFFWLHLFDPHSDYAPPPPFDREFADAPYDGEIAYMDSCLGSFFDRLKEMNLFDRSLIIVAGDHGEGLGEHGEMEHQYLLYHSTIRVPLIIHAGKSPGAGKVLELVGLVDLFPTVLDYLGMDGRKASAGRSLRGVMEGTSEETGKHSYYVETLAGEISLGWSPLFSVVDDQWKFIEAPDPELYQVAEDPLETRNRASGEPALLGRLREELKEILLSQAKSEGSPEAPMDEEARKRLASLGYIAAGSFSKKDLLPSKDPKKYIHLEKDIIALYKLFLSDQRDKIFPHVEAILASDPENRLALLYAGTAYYEKRQYPTALSYLEKLYQFYQDEIGNEMLIRIYIEQRALDKALEICDASVDHFSDKPQFSTLQGMVFAEMRKYPDAIGSFKRSVSLDEANPQPYFYLAKCYASTGDEDSSLEAVKSSLEKGLKRPGVYLRDPVFRKMKRFQEIEQLVASRRKR